MPSRALPRFLIGSTALGLWSAIILTSSLLWLLAAKDAAQVAATTHIARAQLAALVEREVALARAMAEDPALKIWGQDETAANSREAALGAMERARKLFHSTEAFVAIDGTRHFYFLDGKSNAASLVPDYTLRKTEKADEWFFSPALEEKAFCLSVNQDLDLKTTRLYIQATLRSKEGKLGVGGSTLDLDAYLDTIYGRSANENLFLLMSPAGGLQLNPHRQYTLLNAKVGKEQGRMTLQSLTTDAGARTQLEAALKDLGTHPDQVTMLKMPFETGTALVGLTFLPDMDWFLVVIRKPTSRWGPLGLALGALAAGWLLATGWAAWGLREPSSTQEAIKPRPEA